MKKMNQKLLTSVFAASALAVSAFVPVAHAEVSASVGGANMYYWRGLDLGNGDAAIWGDLSVSSEAGLYGGLFVTSGDAGSGQEYDLYFGYGTEFGDFGFDISYWTYSYPSAPTLPGEDPPGPGDLAEIVLGLSYGPVAFTYYHGISDLEDYSYLTLSASFGAFSFLYGEHSEDPTGGIDGYSHFDITYAFNDNVSFTLGNVIDDLDDAFPDAPKFIVNFTIPIE